MIERTIIYSKYCTLYCLYREKRLLHCSFSSVRHHWALTELNIIDRLTDTPIPAFLSSLENYLHLTGQLSTIACDPFFLQKGTVLQQKVWHTLATIPYGHTRTYGEIAAFLGNRHLARAVGQACNKNPLPIIIPCHRVVGKNGIGGFAGGSAIKQRLLEREKGIGE